MGCIGAMEIDGCYPIEDDGSGDEPPDRTLSGSAIRTDEWLGFEIESRHESLPEGGFRKDKTNRALTAQPIFLLVR